MWKFGRDPEKKLVEFARRMAADALKESDSSALSSLLIIAGISADTFETMVAELKADLQDAQAVSGRSSLEKKIEECRAAIEAKRAEQKQAFLAAEALIYELAAVEAAAQQSIAAIEAVELVRSRRRFEHPELFGEIGNLDSFTLTHCGTAINHNDPAAPRLEVPRDVWAHQNARRCELMRRFRRRIAADFLKQSAEWQQQQRSMAARLLSGTGEPVHREVTWTDLIEEGITQDEEQAAQEAMGQDASEWIRSR